MAKIGYIRVSTLDQKTDRQRIALKECKVEKILKKRFQEKI